MSVLNCNDTILTPSLPMENTGWRMLQRVSPVLAAAAMSLFATLCTWQRRVEMRNQLARLDERMLKDIGLGRTDAEIETMKPFWKR